MFNFSGLKDTNSVLSGIKATNTGGNIQLFETAHKGGAKRKSRKNVRRGGMLMRMGNQRTSSSSSSSSSSKKRSSPPETESEKNKRILKSNIYDNTILPYESFSKKIQLDSLLSGLNTLNNEFTRFNGCDNSVCKYVKTTGEYKNLATAINNLNEFMKETAEKNNKIQPFIELLKNIRDNFDTYLPDDNEINKYVIKDDNKIKLNIRQLIEDKLNDDNNKKIIDEVIINYKAFIDFINSNDANMENLFKEVISAMYSLNYEVLDEPYGILFIVDAISDGKTKIDDKKKITNDDITKTNNFFKKIDINEQELPNFGNFSFIQGITNETKTNALNKYSILDSYLTVLRYLSDSIKRYSHHDDYKPKSYNINDYFPDVINTNDTNTNDTNINDTNTNDTNTNDTNTIDDNPTIDSRHGGKPKMNKRKGKSQKSRKYKNSKKNRKYSKKNIRNK